MNLSADPNRVPTCDLDASVQTLRGVGEARAKALDRLGIHTIRELLHSYPRAYEDRTILFPIARAPWDRPVCIRATISGPPQIQQIRPKLELTRFPISDASGAAELTFFNQSYLRHTLKEGQTYIFYGRVDRSRGRPVISNPDYEVEGKHEKTGRVLPRYALCQGISRSQRIAAITTALDTCLSAVSDVIPQEIRTQYELIDIQTALQQIHFPTSPEGLAQARRRLSFEELFVLSVSLQRTRQGHHRPAPVIPSDPAQFYTHLPFTPTDAQRRVIQEALTDMASGQAMNRLVQGDVGSGKTLVAACCLYFAAKAGFQGAFMAPTEILATQHKETLSSMLEPLGITVGLLTGSRTASQRRATQEALADGRIQIAVGTHALLSGQVQFCNLSLVVCDEQHRFGVAQRTALASKGQQVHTLVMSATPIPRTLALMIYADLDVSVVDTLPPGRQTVTTLAVDNSYRQRLYGFLEKLMAEGRQIFVVCPKVDKLDKLDKLDNLDNLNNLDDVPLSDNDEALNVTQRENEEIRNAEEHTRHLREQFPNRNIACLHGRMKPKEKEAIMAQMLAGDIHMLVSTTVIEVGVDIPNAACIVIENAERFGLSTLHQLRGRVGRGVHKSWCIFVSEGRTEEARRRLHVLCQTHDGFRIAQEDLNLRGPGDFFGSRQHGLPEMHIASLQGDLPLLQQAQKAASEVLSRDSELQEPQHAALRQVAFALYREQIQLN